MAATPEGETSVFPDKDEMPLSNFPACQKLVPWPGEEFDENSTPCGAQPPWLEMPP